MRRLAFLRRCRVRLLLRRPPAPLKRLPDGSVFLSRYADVAVCYRDARMSSDKKAEFGPKFGVGTPLYRHHTTSLVFNDPPLHTRVRKLLAAAFTPRALANLQPTTQSANLRPVVDGDGNYDEDAADQQAEKQRIHRQTRSVAAGAIMPNVASSISTIFSQVSSVLSSASSQS